MPRLTPWQSRARRGMTIAELLVTLAIVSLIGVVVSRLMMGQQRFYQRTNEQMGMRRELRSAMSLVPADLRSVSSSGGDLTAMGTSSVSFRSVLGASIICARVSNTVVDLPPTNMARNTLSAWYADPAVGDTMWAFNDSLSRGAEDDVWTPLRVTAVATSSGCTPSPYLDAALDASKPRWRITVTPALPDSVKVGSAIRFTRSARYQLEAQGSGDYYLTRSEYMGGAWGASTPVSGPYAPPVSGGGGIRFAYFDSLGAAVTNVADSRRVARIDLLLRAKGANSSGTFGTSSTQNTDSLAFRIALRNRQ
ncbi:MAG: prepilin-type N-terminal cleavage/methylation domain-containing protein [Gemmatimonadaceae bacterium]|nr:prepilin-type N-terminal cleavage/methylation domain-containing protein [Gemmatimonadaceae bacterium]